MRRGGPHPSLPPKGEGAGNAGLIVQSQATSRARANARVLRREMTDGERLLWSRLRGEQLGVKFRRQHPLGAYIADFACLEQRLIVEIDGSQHADQQTYDAVRDGFFRARGLDVLRFPANAPFLNLDGLLQTLLDRIQALQAPTPTLPQRGRELNTDGARP